MARPHWRIEVFGIANAARRRWIQLALHGRDRYRMLTLSVSRSDSAERIVTALAQWLADPADRPEWVRTDAVSR